MNSESLCQLDSSNLNENFNVMVAKDKHYGDSDSLDFRVAAAVCQKK